MRGGRAFGTTGQDGELHLLTVQQQDLPLVLGLTKDIALPFGYMLHRFVLKFLSGSSGDPLLFLFDLEGLISNWYFCAVLFWLRVLFDL